SQNLDHGQLAIKAALALGSPYTAMLFMGEEWASSRPFQFFNSHPDQELASATAAGRKAEFADHGWDAAKIPDPQDPETFLRSKLDWAEVSDSGPARMLGFYRDLIALRHSEPAMADPWLTHLTVDYVEEQRWIIMRRGPIAIACNLGIEDVDVPAAGEPVLGWGGIAAETDTTRLAGHSVAVLRTT
ncbi:MAG: DUF3459 domain-containing protein, partial [Mycobacterium sp.]